MAARAALLAAAVGAAAARSVRSALPRLSGPLSLTNAKAEGVPLLLRHCNFQAFATPFNEPPDDDYGFVFGPALNGDATGVSLESVDFPGYYLVPGGGAGVEATRLTLTDTFNTDDASYSVTPGASNASLVTLLSLSTNAAYAGLAVTLLPGTLTGDCDSKYAPPAGDVVLAQPTADPAASTWIVGPFPPPQPIPAITVYANAVQYTIPKLYLGCHSDSGYVNQPRGFYSQLIIGEVFEVPWLNFTSPGVTLAAAVSTALPFNYWPTSMALRVTGAGGPAGLVNRGLGNEGFTLSAGLPYEGVVYVQTSGAATQQLYLALADYTTGTVLASLTLPVTPRAGWQALNFTLTPTAATTCVGIVPGSDPVIDCGGQGTEPGHVCVKCGGEFRLGLASPGALAIGYVLLQPGAWGRFNGQPVLASAATNLQALGVTVVRQGGTFGQVIAWKDWRGPAPQRKSIGLTWGQSLISGWGPFEMIDLCNALGIEPIITMAMDLNNATDWADLVEYLFGNASTPWGAQRIADAHPAPYNATWFELGNEQYNPDFVEQVAAMEARATSLGMPGTFRYMFPTNTGLNATDAARAAAAGLPLHNIMPDIHIGANGAVEVAEADFAALPGFPQSAINCETNAGTHDLERALLEAADLNDWFSITPAAQPRILARTASFCTERSGHYDAFDQGISFFLPNMTWLQPPGYVHAMLSQTWAPSTVLVNVTGGGAAPASAADVAHRRAARLRGLARSRGAPARQQLRLQPNDLFSVSAQLAADGGTLYLRFVNMQGAAAAVATTIVGFTWAAAATQITLASGSLNDANTPGAPTFVSPVTTPVVVATTPTTTFNLPALSYTIFVLTAA